MAFFQALGSLTLCAAEFDTLEAQRGFHRGSVTLVSRVMDGKKTLHYRDCSRWLPAETSDEDALSGDEIIVQPTQSMAER
ncbi:uncharacterized protein BKA55DRAFT_560736 [Fusarium redolens]|jgi:hypothetical protein|uniref:Uncharacterized protein n=1 Tax=Fusarium redolens TaxID=48865 RepID=A0A9P9HQB7_FUSRE|nr:uncharacterized protein BKA55DRAFT_560736 [Fusarium redolens]KAH7261227.1 hypothetical protein BKA55DRAFT_560736 [Fusarium redolens]